MIHLRPGSVPWLIRQELRLMLRSAVKVSWRVIIVLGLFLIGLAALGGVPLAVLAWALPGTALIATLGVTASALSRELTRQWHERPVPRSTSPTRPGALVPTLGGCLSRCSGAPSPTAH